MNERIRELVKQAGGEFWQRLENDAVKQDAYITFDPPDSLEKFAELIVKECGVVAYKTYCQTPGALGIQYKQAIEKHFGVEE